MEPDYHPKYSNCLSWALEMLNRHGGMVEVYRGVNGFPFHPAWRPPDGGRAWCYAPLRPTGLLRRYWRTGETAPRLLVVVATIMLWRYRGRVEPLDEYLAKPFSPLKEA